MVAQLIIVMKFSNKLFGRREFSVTCFQNNAGFCWFMVSEKYFRKEPFSNCFFYVVFILDVYTRQVTVGWNPEEQNWTFLRTFSEQHDSQFVYLCNKLTLVDNLLWFGCSVL